MKISDCMKTKVIVIKPENTMQDAIDLLIKHHIGMLPVVDDDNKLVGVLSLRTVLSTVMPDFIKLLDDFHFVRDFGAVENRKPSREDLSRRVGEIMDKPISVKADSSLIYAVAMLRQGDLSDISVTDAENHLIGIASRVDIGTAVMRSWQENARSQDVLPK
ncbi:MAG: CBS domain-containing protein [Anaerolineae bacterium]|nr:CBS domain-containing protein [Anaerolineae bacterium]